MKARIGVAATVTVVVSAFITAWVATDRSVAFAYENSELHVGIETAALVLVLAAWIIAGRYQSGRRSSDLYLLGAMGLLAVTVVAFSTAPAIIGVRESAFIDWAALCGRLLAGALFLLAAFAPDAPFSPASRQPRLMPLAVPALAGACALAAGILAPAMDLDWQRELDTHAGPLLGQAPALTIVNAISVLLYAGAAAGFVRRALRGADELIWWIAFALVLAAFSRVHYTFYPSIDSSLVFTGDLFRLGFYGVLFAGALRELASYQRSAIEAARIHERRRVGRDLHDGIANDLAFIASGIRHLADQPSPEHSAALAEAADRAFGESRLALELLAADGSDLELALERTVEEVTGRAGVRMSFEADPGPRPSPAVQEAVLRIAREATANAVRHGTASVVSVTLRRDAALRLQVSDDGGGIPEDARHGHGISGMRERAEELGGELRLTQSAHGGTTVEAVIP